ncbi:MAG: hypothetical protein JNL79_13305 [Myxococcales bacterium]|nr:hypothetical protein [Myxococcales bacterium]
MARTIQRPERLLQGFFVLLCLPFLAVAVAGVRSAGHEGVVATALALIPLPAFLFGFQRVARAFRADPQRYGVVGLAVRLVPMTLVVAGVPSAIVVGLHALHVPATGTYVVVGTQEGACLVERDGNALRTGDDHPEALVPALRALAASTAPLREVTPAAVVGARVRVFRKSMVAAEGVVTEVYGTRAGRRAWARVKKDDGSVVEVALLSLCGPRP